MKNIFDSPMVSCSNIAWHFDICKSKNVDAKRLMRNINLSKDYLINPNNFIDWLTFATFSDNFLNYFSESTIRDAGKNSWQSANMRYFQVIGNLIYTAHEHFLFTFGPMGFIAKNYPCEMTISEQQVGKMTINLQMKHNLIPCRSFHLSIAGQMAGLPESLGLQEAQVLVKHKDNGAEFNIVYEARTSIYKKLRHACLRLFNSQQTARELTQNYNLLQENRRDLYLAKREEKQTQSKFKNTASLYKLLSNNVTDVIWTADLELNLLYISPSFERLTGHKPEAGIHKPLVELFTKESFYLINNGLDTTLSNTSEFKESYSFDAQLIKKNGHTIWVEVTARIELDQQGQAVKIIGIAKDISEKKTISDRLDRSEKKHQLITETALDAIFSFDKDGRIFFVNPSTVRIFGYSKEELLNLNLKSIIPEAYQQSPSELVDIFGENIDLIGISKDGKNIPLEVSFAQNDTSSLSFISGIARDISARNKAEKERQKLQTQLYTAQKMESIGQLSGGIAHDFNNLLVAINGYAELGIKKLNSSSNQFSSSIEAPDAASELLHYFSEIEQAGNRAADLTQKLLAFGRRQLMEPKAIDLSGLINNLNSMMQRLIPQDIEIIVIHEHTPLMIMADRVQIEQILINLLVNSRDAINNGGVIKIETQKHYIDSLTAINSQLETGYFVSITVTDTGEGMDNETQKRVFEPFFTTKPEGAGTGLGMSVVFGIVKQHGGQIELDSKIGQGTKFTIHLPCTNELSIANEEISLITSAGGSEFILIVEDNNQVRELVCLNLEAAGYHVKTAANGEVALNIFREYFTRIDLVIMDVVMPRMGGREVMREMQKIKPTIKVLFTSGYSSDGNYTDFIQKEKLNYLQKPYHNEVIRRKVRQMFDT